MNTVTEMNSTTISNAPTDRQPWRNPWVLLLAVIALALVAGLGYYIGTRSAQTPGRDSAEAGFARDMIVHHAQAVEMATIFRDQSFDPEMRQFALDILLTQQNQIGQMEGWLSVWDVPLASTDPAMGWMGMPTTGPMPGMASPADINRLRGLTGSEADVLFLQLMIPHHRAAIDMSQVILNKSNRSEVQAIAQSIINGQQSEIDYMQDLLTRKGVAAAPLPASTTMPGMNHFTPTP